MNFNDMSPQYRNYIVRRGMGLCPVAGCKEKSSTRSPKRGYCERHIELKAASKRKSIGAKRRYAGRTVWADIDWTLGPDLICAMLGVKRSAVMKRYKKAVALGHTKTVPGFMPGVRKKK